MKIPVAVLGATGLVGQHLVRLLDDHPWFLLSEVVASDRRAGQRYGDVVPWIVSDAPPMPASDLILRSTTDEILSPLILSALPAGSARVVEPRLVEAGHVVCTNASAHRMDPSVPLVVPEVNADAVRRGAGAGPEGPGAIVANPNCVATGLAVALAPIERAWGISSATVVTLQALSGAGLSGPGALTMSSNVVPWIDGEEEKIGQELSKLLGVRIPMAVAVNRVPVVDGHTAHVFLQLRRRAQIEAVAECLTSFRPDPPVRDLPSIPSRPIVVRSEVDRPQPARDAGAEGGMAVSVGRLRAAPPYDVALTVVSHNAVRGAAGACLANAELCVAKGLVPGIATGSRTPLEASSSELSPSHP